MSEVITVTISAVALTVPATALAPALLAVAGAMMIGHLSRQLQQLFEEVAAAAPSHLDVIRPAEAALRRPGAGPNALSPKEARLLSALAA